MISEYDVIRTYRNAKEKGKDYGIILSDDEKTLTFKDGDFTVTVAEFAQFMREKQRCDFEVIYDEHVSLSCVIRCRECGTVIFTREDEEYDPKLCCPTCGGYKTHFEYWTKEEIEADEKKQNEIQAMIEMQKYMRESYARRKKRGLSDWGISKKTIKFGKNKYEFSLECSNLFSKNRKGLARLKGLNLHITTWAPDAGCNGSYIGKRFTRIPLSPYAFYIQFVVPYKKDAHPSIKKYYPWQKKPEKENV